MRILTVCHYYPPHVGGLEIAVQNLARTFVELGHGVDVITCAHRGRQSETREESGIRVHSVYARNMLDTRFGIPFPIPSLRMLRKIWREINAADLVHIHDVLYIPSWIAYICATLHNKPIFLTQHVAVVEHTNPLVMAVQRVVYATWGRRIFRASDRIIVHNAVVKAFVSTYAHPNKVIELRNGINQALFRPARDTAEKEACRRAFHLPDRPLVLFVGRFVPKKGVDVLFAARDDAYDLVFAGSGDIKKEWKAARNVHVVGALCQEELAQLYRAADICVLPSKGELFTLALQEGAASGLPIVTTDEPAYDVYNLDREGIGLVESTPTVLRTTIKTILSDQEKYNRMAEYSRTLADRWFDHAKNSTQLARVYEDFEESRRIVTTSWDDGHVLDLKLAELLKKYGVAGTFYVSPEDRELKPESRLTPEQVRQLSTDFEIGAHTMTHPYLPDVDARSARYEIVGSKEVLESWTGQPVTSFCYPKGGYTREHEAMVREAGFSRARTVRRFSFKTGMNNPFAEPTTIHAYDHWSDIWPLLKLVKFNPIAFFRLYHRWDRQAMALFDRVLAQGGVFHLWGHSWEVDINQDWTRLENVLQYIADRKGVKYVANNAVSV